MLSLVAVAVALFCSLAAVNLVLDPWWVFRILPETRLEVAGNDRYNQLRAYEAEPDRYDAVLLASSRGRQLPRDQLARLVGATSVASFAVSFGRLQDHVATLDYVLRDKAARGGRLKAVFLLIDVDTLGDKTRPVDTLQQLEPPAISGEPAIRFWWKNLTAIQFPAWRRALLRQGIVRPTLSPAAAETAAPPASPSAESVAAEPTSASPGERITIRPHYEEEVGDWSRIVASCRDNGVRLVTALSPISPQVLPSIDADDLAVASTRIGSMAPVWDFSGRREPSNRPDLWYDRTHFDTFVGEMMVDRMMGASVPSEWSGFGRIRRP